MIKTGTVFSATEYYEYLSELTGLPRREYELIAIDEFLSLFLLPYTTGVGHKEIIGVLCRG